MAFQRILVIDELPPAPDSSSGGRRAFEILKLLRADGHAVAFMPHAVKAGTSHYLDALRNIGIQVTAPSEGTGVEPTGFRQTFAGFEFDTVIISFHRLAQRYLPLLRELFPRARVIIDTIDLHWVREERRAEVSGDAALAAAAAENKRDELSTYQRADELWAITSIERDLLHDAVPGKPVHVIPNVHDVVSSAVPFEARNGLLFVGNFWHPPNAEGIAWFFDKVLPLIWDRIPDLVVRVVGANMRSEIKAFAPPGVEMLGWVADIEPLLKQSRVSISPLRHGAGMKGKVGEALAYGLPVVTTAIGAEGIGLTDGKNALIADSAADFASAVVRAYTDAAVWQTLSVNGQAHIAANYTPDRVQHLVRDAIGHAFVPLQYFGVPDWSNAEAVKSVIDTYIRTHLGNVHASLLLGLLDVPTDTAFDLLASWIAELGHDLDNIPDVQLVPVSMPDLASLSSDTIWIPMRSDVPPPTHLSQSLAVTTSA